MGHGMRDVHQNFAIGCLLAPTVRCAEKDESQGDIANGIISRLEARLKQCLLNWSVADFRHGAF